MPTSRPSPDRDGEGRVGTTPSAIERVGLVVVAALTLLAALSLGGGVAGAQTADEQAVDAPATDAPAAEDPAADGEALDPAVVEQLRDGSEVYTQICSSCHQPGGAGLPGQYPPLSGNPNVDDSAYVTDVINNGLQGEIVVNGETYNGVMPSFSTLSDDDVAAVIAYMQNDFVVPAGADEQAAPLGPVAGTELPALTNMSALVAYLLAAVVAGLVLAPRLISANDRLSVPWLDAWLKTATIVVAVVLLTVIVPDWALKTSTVSKLSRTAQDVIGMSLWGAGLAVLLGALWYAHRESRI